MIERAPADRGIFVVWNGEYRAVEDSCEELVGAIAAVRPGQEILEQKPAFFEKAHVFWFPPAS